MSKTYTIKTDNLYPALYKEAKGKSVVFFTNLTEGVEIVTESGQISQSLKSEHFAPCNAKDYWKRMPKGTVFQIRQS